MKGIAFYGKGGIGKSTTLSNVTAALSMNNKKILQIGCDPKHDSTRLLLGGFTQSTVLEQLKTTGTISLDQIMLTGYNGINCIECGGPEPGVGCAGRGIIQTLNLLTEQGLDTEAYDYVFFDVLGDVVCGGFAMPMRKGYANEVYIVTSGEIASIYAANNIAKGIKRFCNPQGKLGGIIGNGRGTKNEQDVISEFAKRIGTKMVAFVPHSELVVQAEIQSEPIVQYAPNSKLASIYRSIGNHIASQSTPVVPTPLLDEELDCFLAEFCYGKKVKKNVTPSYDSSNSSYDNSNLVKNSVSKIKRSVCSTGSSSPSLDNQKDQRWCSLVGAISVVRQIKDAFAVIHSPSGCSFLHFWMHMIADLQSDFSNLIFPNFLCTNLQENDVIFGGNSTLKNSIMAIQKRVPSSTIFVITSCLSGIIGDDINSMIEEFKTLNVTLIPVTSDGMLTGDPADGIFLVYQAIAENLIDENVTPKADMINIIGGVAPSQENKQAYDELHKILQVLGISINCRFAQNTSLSELKRLKQASTNVLLADELNISKRLPEFIKECFNMEMLSLSSPVGYEPTEKFVQTLATHFGKEKELEKLLTSVRKDYERQLAPLRNYFSGKKVVIFSYSINIDWLISTLLDLDIKIERICVMPLSSNSLVISTKYLKNLQVETDFQLKNVEQVIRETSPDFVLAASMLSGISYSVPCYTFPVRPNYGFNSGLEYVQSLQSQLRIQFIEGWKNDNKLF